MLGKKQESRAVARNCAMPRVMYLTLIRSVWSRRSKSVLLCYPVRKIPG